MRWSARSCVRHIDEKASRGLEEGKTSVMETCLKVFPGGENPESAVQSLDKPRNERGGSESWGEC